MVKIPHHLGIIIDGNRRWAEENQRPIFHGHIKGMERVGELVEAALNRGIKILTLFVFSTENWKRPKKEVDYLMRLLKLAFNGQRIRKANRQGVKIKVIGQKENLAESLQKIISKAEKLTENNKKMTLNFALSYGGRAEITEAIKNIVKKGIPPEKITEETISQNLWTTDLDLLIRTGKEQRLSNFLIWQAAYSELYFCQKYWPEFTSQDLDEAILDYNQRQRRFGA